MANKLKSSFEANSYLSYKLMYNELNKNFRFEAHHMQLHKAKRKALEEVEKSYANNYKKLS